MFLRYRQFYRQKFLLQIQLLLCRFQLITITRLFWVGHNKSYKKIASHCISRLSPPHGHQQGLQNQISGLTALNGPQHAANTDQSPQPDRQSPRWSWYRWCQWPTLYPVRRRQTADPGCCRQRLMACRRKCLCGAYNQYEPWSEWIRTLFFGFLRHTAMSKAWRTRSVVWRLWMDQPTTRREYRSITTAK